MRSRLLLVAMALVAMTMPAFAGGGGEDGADGPVELRLATAFDPVRLAQYQASVERFEAANPGISVTLENTPWVEYWNKIQAQTATGTMPDVWNYVPGFGEEYLVNDRLLPIDDFVESDPDFDLDDFFPGMLGYLTKDGMLHGLPYDVSGQILYYNKDLFDAAGVDYPADNWTHQDMVAAARQIVSSVGQINGQDVYGIATFPIESFYSPSYFEAWGGGYIDESLDVLIDRPQSIDLLEFWADLADEENTMVPLDEATAATGDFEFTSWLAGRVAMYPNISVLIGQFTEAADFEWDIAEVPFGPRQVPGTLLGGAFTIDVDTDHPEEAWLLLKHLTSEDELRRIVAEPAAGTPARFSSADALPPMMRKATDILGTYQDFNSIRGIASVWETQSNELELVWLGEKSPAAAAEAIADRAREIIDENY